MQINWKTIEEIVELASKIHNAHQQRRFIENRLIALGNAAHETSRHFIQASRDFAQRLMRDYPGPDKRPSTMEDFYPKKKGRTELPTKKKTKIYYEEEKEMVTEDHSHNDLYKYKHHISFSHKKAHKRLGYWDYFTQKNGIVIAQEGKQGCAEIWSLGTALQVFAKAGGLTTINVSDEQNIYKWSVSPYSLNPYQTVPAGNLYAGQSAPVIDKIHLESVDATTIIVNTEPIPLQVELVWLTPKKSQADGPLQSWRNVMTDKGLGIAANDNPDYSNVNPTFSAVARATDDMYGMSPFGHIEFRRQWKTLHRKSFYLNAGDQRKIMTRIHYNKTWDREALKQTFQPNDVNDCTSAANYWAPGISICCMAIVRPGNVILPAIDGNRPVSVTTGRAQIGFVNATNHRFSSMGSTDRISTLVIQPGFFRETSTAKSGRFMDVTDQFEVDDKLLQNK